MYQPGYDSAQVWQALLARAGAPKVAHRLLDDSALDPLRALLHALGQPQARLRCVHIAGSKGKGSTALYLERLLRGAGLHVATFSSPHLQNWRERFRLDGAPVGEQPLLAAAQAVHAVLRGLPQNAGVRFFDCLTALALQLFAQAAPDWAVIESGVGGDRDATSVINAQLAVLTRIELEHCDVLGDSLAQIATHKAGIIRAGVPVLSAACAPPAAAVIERRAAALGAPLRRLGRDFDYRAQPAGAGRHTVEYRGHGRLDFALPVAAAALCENAALALASTEALRCHLDSGLVQDAFRQALPARCEMFPGSPAVLVDAAHTPASFAILREALANLAPARLHLLLAASSARHLRALAALGALAQSVLVTQADADYSVAPEILAGALRETCPGLRIALVNDPAQGLARARAELAGDGLLCVTGSTYLAGAVRALLAPGGQ